MGRRDDLSMTPLQKSHELSLEIGMHVNVRFVENHGLMILRACEEPHCLKPHLQAVTNPTHFRGEVAVANHQRESARLTGIRYYLERLNPQVRPC